MVGWKHEPWKWHRKINRVLEGTGKEMRWRGCGKKKIKKIKTWNRLEMRLAERADFGKGRWGRVNRNTRRYINRKEFTKGGKIGILKWKKRQKISRSGKSRSHKAGWCSVSWSRWLSPHWEWKPLQTHLNILMQQLFLLPHMNSRQYWSLDFLTAGHGPLQTCSHYWKYSVVSMVVNE